MSAFCGLVAATAAEAAPFPATAGAAVIAATVTAAPKIANAG
ncbi:MAG TPA: hypothetical protein VNF47_09640 [Streptosporangiaceae bacterium]|nr:hypothetical protein [Streptosporangiaceae bacterium]